jgi:hypothetical protein
MKSTLAPRPGLFIGSTTYEIKDTREAIEHFVAPLLLKPKKDQGPFSIPAIPWGETTDPHWVDEQLQQFDNISALKRAKKSTFGLTERYLGMPRYKVRKGQTINIDEINLLFEERARHAFPIMQKVCQEHGLKDQYLEIGIDTIDLVCFALWWTAPKYIDVFIEKTKREIEAIWKLTDGKVRFVVEVPMASVLAALTRGNSRILNWYADTLVKLIDTFPPEAEWVLHNCNGRLGGDAVIDQGPLRILFNLLFKYKPEHEVKMNNILLHKLEAAKLLPIGVQFPFAFGSRAPSLDEKDYKAYADAYIPKGVLVYGGAISSELNLQQHKQLYQMFDRIFKQRVGMSSTCGHGSNDLATMKAEIDTMTRVAYM